MSEHFILIFLNLVFKKSENDFLKILITIKSLIILKKNTKYNI